LLKEPLLEPRAARPLAGEGNAVVMGLSEGHAAVMKAKRDGQGLQTIVGAGYQSLKAGRR
jgi:hypothetical protein